MRREVTRSLADRPRGPLFGLPVEFPIAEPHNGYAHVEARRAQAMLATLQRERGAAFLRWFDSQHEVAARAAAHLMGELTRVGSEQLLRALGELYPTYYDLFGCDEWSAEVLAAHPVVYEDGVGVEVTIRTWFGGGERWFGPPGNRHYKIIIDVPGGAPWVRPPRDEAFENCLREAAAVSDRLWHRYTAFYREAHDRAHQAWSAYHARAARDGYGTYAAERAKDLAAHRADRAYASAAKVHPSRFRVDSLGPIDIWPGKARMQRRAVPVMRTEHVRWLHLCAHLARVTQPEAA